MTAEHVNMALRSFSRYNTGPVEHNSFFREQDFLEAQSVAYQTSSQCFRSFLLGHLVHLSSELNVKIDQEIGHH